MSPLPVVKEPASWAVLVRSREEVRKVLEAAQQHNEEELAPVRTQETRGHACRRVGGCGVVLTGACSMLLPGALHAWLTASACMQVGEQLSCQGLLELEGQTWLQLGSGGEGHAATSAWLNQHLPPELDVRWPAEDKPEGWLEGRLVIRVGLWDAGDTRTIQVSGRCPFRHAKWFHPSHLFMAAWNPAALRCASACSRPSYACTSTCHSRPQTLKILQRIRVAATRRHRDAAGGGAHAGASAVYPSVAGGSAGDRGGFRDAAGRES